MPEAALDDGQLYSGFEQPGRICVPQGVDTARLGDCGLLFGSLVDMPGPVAAERASQEFIGEQPGLGTLATPVLAQLRQQPRREGDVAVLVALALVDTQQHPFGIDVAQAHPPNLARPQPRGIGRHQH